LTDRLTFLADEPYGLELEHVKFALHHEDCSSLCSILTSVPLGGGILIKICPYLS